MKNTLTIIFVLCSLCVMAQRGYSTSDYARSEIGVSGGIFVPDNVPVLRLQFPIRVADHIQVAPSLLYALDGIEDIGKRFLVTVNLNFPVSKSRSYFYPGLEVGYLMGIGLAIGGHIGYTLALGDRIGLNIQPGLITVSNTKQAGISATIEAGIRISLD